jgi:hypothetical protein
MRPAAESETCGRAERRGRETRAERRLGGAAGSGGQRRAPPSAGHIPSLWGYSVLSLPLSSRVRRSLPLRRRLTPSARMPMALVPYLTFILRGVYGGDSNFAASSRSLTEDVI